MRRKKTRAELEFEIRDLSAYREAFFCRAETPLAISSGEGEDRIAVSVIGLSRAAGGVVLLPLGGVEWACDWCQRVEALPYANAYAREVARLIRRAQSEAAFKGHSDTWDANWREERSALCKACGGRKHAPHVGCDGYSEPKAVPS